MFWRYYYYLNRSVRRLTVRIDYEILAVIIYNEGISINDNYTYCSCTSLSVFKTISIVF